MSNLWLIIFSHSRPHLAQKSLESVNESTSKVKWKKMHIYQSGHVNSHRFFKERLSDFNVNIQQEPKFGTALANINFNRVLGYRLAFDVYGADAVLGIEEDTILSPDSLSFCESIYSRYSREKRFRGINLGSLETSGLASNNSFSLLRFGLQGQAGLITRKTWNSIRDGRILDFDSGEGWDSSIEFKLKTGYMVTPNRSRSLDFGWDQGVHAPQDENDPHYVSMRQSWVGTDPLPENQYELVQLAHRWRKDSISYIPSQNFIFSLRNTFVYHLFRTTPVVFRRKILALIYHSKK
jgi:hypothetical protein